LTHAALITKTNDKHNCLYISHPNVLLISNYQSNYNKKYAQNKTCLTQVAHDSFFL